MQLYYFLAIVLSLSFGSLPPSNGSFGHAIGFSALAIAAWWCLCYLAVRLVAGLIDDAEVSLEVGSHWFDRQTECFRWFSLGLVVLCLGGFGLGRNLDQLPVIKHSLAAQSVVLLTPAIAMMTGLWAAEYLFAARLGMARHSVVPALRSIFAALRCSVGWLIVPILVLMLSVDLLTLTALTASIPPWIGWGALAAILVVGMPVLIRRIFPTMPIDEPTRVWIESIVQAAGVRHCKIVMWDTGGRTHNAMIGGLLGRFRVLLVSDRLLEDLSREELSMVILHEVAHAKRFHVPLRIAALLPAWILGAALEGMIVRWADTPSGVVAPTLEALAQWSGTLGSALSLTATILILRVVSYRSEYDADAIACRLAPLVAARCPDVPLTEDDAGRCLGSALLRVTVDSESSRKASWLHPGINDRIDAFSAASV
jgi:Zn-dependent protease with chaperone function